MPTLDDKSQLPLGLRTRKAIRRSGDCGEWGGIGPSKNINCCSASGCCHANTSPPMLDLLIFQKKLETVLLVGHLTILKDLLIKKKV